MKQLNSKEKAEINAQIEREHDEEIEKFKQKHHQPLIDEINKVLQGHELLLNELELAYEDLVKEQAALKVYVDADKSIYEAYSDNFCWYRDEEKNLRWLISAQRDYLNRKKALQLKK